MAARSRLVFLSFLARTVDISGGEGGVRGGGGGRVVKKMGGGGVVENMERECYGRKWGGSVTW